MKKVIIVLVILMYGLPTFAQICGTPPPDDILQGLTGNCTTNSIWGTSSAYIPTDEEMSELTIKVNFIFWQREDGVIGNFQADNADHNYFISEVISEMNRRVSNLVDPQDLSCYVSSPDYIADSKIKFDVEKYYIADGYLWDIENATTSTAYCPAWWSQTYTDLAYQRLEEHGVRHGINVFFGNEGSAFQTLLIDHLTDDYNSVASNTDCSEYPEGQDNLGKLSRVEMTNEFLQYEFRGNVTQDPNWQLSFDELKYSLARVIVHELGHSFHLPHTNISSPNCEENVMFFGGQIKNYFNSAQLGIIHNSVHLESVRQYVVCEGPGKKPRVLNGYHQWGFDTKIYTDIILESGAELEICGNVYMPKGGRIHVKRGAKLYLNGGKISFNRKEYEDCSDEYWGGIVIWGNGNKRHADIDVDNLQANDPGVLILDNDALIEYAELGINAFRYPTVFPEPTNNEGGIVLANNSTFKNCKHIASFSPYEFENMSYFKDCAFFSDDGSTKGGIRAVGIQHLEVESCSFDNLGDYGIKLVNSGANIYNGCSFTQMTHGIYAGASHFQTASVAIGSADESVDRNFFLQNTCGIYAFGVGKLIVANNDFDSNNFGLAIKGETGGHSFGNEYKDLIIGEHYEQSSFLGKTSTCNYFDDLARGIYVVGDNKGLSFFDNEFQNITSHDNIDVMLVPKEAANGTTLGEIYRFQGSPENAIFNLFTDHSSTIKIHSFQGTTETFYYYTDLNTTEDRFIPDCSINNPGNCGSAYNFYTSFAVGYPGSCLEYQPKSCETKDCLEEQYEVLFGLLSIVDGGNKEGLLDVVDNFMTYPDYKQILLNASPYLSEEVLLALAGSNIPKIDKAELLTLNAPLSAVVMDAAEYKIAPAEYANLESIKAQNPIASLDLLNNSIQLAEQDKNEALLANLNRLKKEGDMLGIEELLVYDNSYLSKRMLLTFKAQQGDITQAEILLANLPVITVEETEAFEILKIIIDQYKEGEAFHLDNDQLDVLYSIAKGQSAQSAYAMGLLMMYKDEVFVPELPEETVSSLYRDGNEVEEEISLIDKQNKGIRVYPNPVTEQLHLDIPSYYVGEELNLVVQDIYGRSIYKTTFTNIGSFDMDFSNMESGIYLIQMHNGTEIIFSEKVIRN